MTDNNLTSLLLAAEQLSSEIHVDANHFRRTNRTLRELVDSSDKLYSKLAAVPQNADANVLLSSKGIDLTHLTRKLESITSQKVVLPRDPFSVTDIPNYLSYKKENAILSIIEETHQRFDKLLEEKMDTQLEKEATRRRNNLLNNLDQLTARHDDIPIIRREVKQYDPLLALSSPFSQLQMIYANDVLEFNSAFIEGKVVSLTEKFKSSVSSFADQKTKDIWNIVTSLQMPIVADSEDVLRSRLSPFSVEAMITQARSYLEERYSDYVDSVVSKNLLHTKRGGIPGTFATVVAYVKLRIGRNYAGMEHVFVDDLPFWPLCYYCVRCGDPLAALQAVRRTECDMPELSKALGALSSSSSLRLPDDLAKSFKSHAKNFSDPYKRILYCIFGACGPMDKHDHAIRTADDYLWFQLCVVNMPNQQTVSTSDSESISYTELQNIISRDYGESTFKATEKPILNFQMLFLTGQFEAAIHSLMSNDKLSVHAVHVAMALNEQSLLALPRQIKKPIISADDGTDKVPMQRLNFCALVKMYVEHFQKNDPLIALHYYFSLRNVYTDNTCVFPRFVIELALETEHYDKIFGHVLENGSHVPGYLSRFVNDETLEMIIKEAASILAGKGRYFDAVKLYNLSNDCESLLRIANNLLSQHLTNPITDSSKMDVINYAENAMSKRDSTQRSTVHVNTVKTFYVLKQLLVFFQFYSAKQYKNALEIIGNLNLVPLQKNDLEIIMERFGHIDPLVLRTISDVLITVMKILCDLYKETRMSLNSMGSNKPTESNLQHLRESAEAVLSFAGKIPYQLPADTNAKLVQLNVSMV